MYTVPTHSISHGHHWGIRLSGSFAATSARSPSAFLLSLSYACLPPVGPTNSAIITNNNIHRKPKIFILLDVSFYTNSNSNAKNKWILNCTSIFQSPLQTYWDKDWNTLTTVVLNYCNYVNKNVGHFFGGLFWPSPLLILRIHDERYYRHAFEN